MIYEVHQLRDNNRPGPPGLIEAVDNNREIIAAQGNQIFGAFGSLLGLASNEIYLVTFGDKETQLELADNIECISTRSFKPTVRPTEHQPATEPGIYVFRWFRVEPTTVDEIAQLSLQAWPDFEGSFETKVQGLLAENTDNPDTMLLITWYKNLTVWEASRQPPQTARDNFLRRHQLTLSALPVATSLLDAGPSRLVSHS